VTRLRTGRPSLPDWFWVKNAWSYTFTSSYVFMVWYLVKHRNNFTFYLTKLRSRVSSMVQRWATDWMIGGSCPARGWEFFSSPPSLDRLWGPPSLLSNGYPKWPRREAGHSLLSSAEVKNGWNYTSTTPSWRGDILKRRDDFAFTLPNSQFRTMLKPV
jgi:hypothetical protein